MKLNALVLAAALSVVPLAVPGAAPSAWAGSERCGSMHGLCVEVVGAGSRVDQVKGKAKLPTCNKTVSYHFEFFAGSWRHSTPEKIHKGSCLGGQAQPETEYIPVNQDFPAGTLMCARVAYREGNVRTTPYREECVKISA